MENGTYQMPLRIDTSLKQRLLLLQAKSLHGSLNKFVGHILASYEADQQELAELRERTRLQANQLRDMANELADIKNALEVLKRIA